MERSGVAYVRASDLESDGRVAVKNLPDHDEVVACSGQRCALVKDIVRKGDDLWVSTAALETALGLKVRFNGDRSSVSLIFESQEASATESPARVGQLAPNFQVARLDGSLVSLADFRGKRVVINSWASW
jgi:hypothetical protein